MYVRGDFLNPNCKQRELIPYVPPGASKPLKCSVACALFRLSNFLNHHFHLRYRFYILAVLLFYLGFYLGCFWQSMFVPNGIYKEVAPILCLTCSMTFLFSVGFFGIFSSPVLCTVHAFFSGIDLSSASDRTYVFTFFIFFTHFLTVIFYAEAISTSLRTLSGARLFLRSRETHLYIIVFIAFVFTLNLRV